jgi:hypothetical protein
LRSLDKDAFHSWFSTADIGSGFPSLKKMPEIIQVQSSSKKNPHRKSSGDKSIEFIENQLKRVSIYTDFQGLS